MPKAGGGAKRAAPASDGAVAQLGERYTGSVEVRGSIPLGSTNFSVFRARPGDGWLKNSEHLCCEVRSGLTFSAIHRLAFKGF